MLCSLPIYTKSSSSAKEGSTFRDNGLSSAIQMVAFTYVTTFIRKSKLNRSTNYNKAIRLFGKFSIRRYSHSYVSGATFLDSSVAKVSHAQDARGSNPNFVRF